MWWKGVEWIYLAEDMDQDRVCVNSVMRLGFPNTVRKAVDLLTSRVTGRFSKTTLLRGLLVC